MVERLGPSDEFLAVLTFFLRLDSFPLESERLGEPGRLRVLLFFKGSSPFLPPDGVVLPLVLAPDAFTSLASGFLPSSSFLLSSFFSLSDSESDS